MSESENESNSRQEAASSQVESTANTAVTAVKNEQRPGYQIPLGRMTLYLFATLGYYVHIWAYKHFKALLPPGKKARFVFWLKVIFPAISLFGLLNGYELRAKKKGLSISLNKTAFAWTYLFFIVLFNVLDNRIQDLRLTFWLSIAELTVFIPLLLSQRNINLLLSRIEPEEKPARMHLASKIATAFGLLIFAAVGTILWFAPEIQNYTDSVNTETQSDQTEEHPKNAHGQAQ